MAYPDHWEADVVLADGGTAHLRPISPHDASLVVEHCDMTGAYITRDAGASWLRFNLRGTISAFAFDPNHGNVLAP